jgi:hypothetical protein
VGAGGRNEQALYAHMNNKRKMKERKKKVRCKMYFFQKLTQFSKGNNVLDAAACSMDVFLREIHVFLQLN